MPDESKERGLWNAKVIFVLGGPGAAKGTQCSRIVSSYQIHYFSIGDVLRAELAKVESQYANIIRQNMSEGRVGPPEITLALLKAAMSEKAVKGEETVFLVGGMHRSRPSTSKTPCVNFAQASLERWIRRSSLSPRSARRPLSYI